MKLIFWILSAEPAIPVNQPDITCIMSLSATICPWRRPIFLKLSLRPVAVFAAAALTSLAMLIGVHILESEMSLKLMKIKNWFKKYGLLGALIILALGLTLNFLLQKRKPETPVSPPLTSPSPKAVLQEPVINGLTIPIGFQLNITDFPLASQLRLYQGQTASFSESRIKQMAKQLNFSSQAEVVEDVILGKIMLWQENDWFLNVNPDLGTFDYKRDLYLASLPEEGLLPSPEQAQKKLLNLLEKLKIQVEFEKKWVQEVYLTHGLYLNPVSDSQEADYLKVGFNPQINLYPLLGLSPTEPLASLTLDKNQEIIRFRWRNNFEKFEPQAFYDLKNEAEIRRSLSREGKIIYTSSSALLPENTNLYQVKFDQIFLAYFQEATRNTLIQPIFVLEGQGVYRGEEIEITAYLPALASKYFAEDEELAPETTSTETQEHFGDFSPFPENFSF